MHARYSIQQIKFELLSYMKEFGTEGSEWHIAAVDEQTGQAIARARAAIWITKPAVSPRAAGLVCQHMIDRFGVLPIPPLQPAESANWVLMYRQSGSSADANA